MDWTADTQRIGRGLDTSVREIGLHTTCLENISYLLLNGGLTLHSSVGTVSNLLSKLIMVFNQIYVEMIRIMFTLLL